MGSESLKEINGVRVIEELLLVPKNVAQRRCIDGVNRVRVIEELLLAPKNVTQRRRIDDRVERSTHLLPIWAVINDQK